MLKEQTKIHLGEKGFSSALLVESVDETWVVLQVLQRRLGRKALSLREDQRNPTLGTLGHEPG
jgi:hypothetical protein